MATVYCVECRQKLCQDCAECHKKFTATRRHKIVIQYTANTRQSTVKKKDMLSMFVHFQLNYCTQTQNILIRLRLQRVLTTVNSRSVFLTAILPTPSTINSHAHYHAICVYSMQPVVQPVAQPVLQLVVMCKTV